MAKKTFNIITIGCQMNKSDSERIASYLDELGYQKINERKKADLVVLTTCGIRQSAEDRVYGLVPKIKKDNSKAKIVLTGCLSERKDVKKRLKAQVDIWLPIIELPNLAEKLGENKKIKSYKDYLEIKPKYRSKISAFVPIGNGCNNFCSYCVVPYARGREVYRDYKEIYNEVKNLVKKGYKEIILIAQNVNSYKFPLQQVRDKQFFNGLKEINFPQLLKFINGIEGDFWIRFATSHPKDMGDDLITAVAECAALTEFSTGKVCEHIHLAAQSGDDKILKAMNRKYTAKYYLELIKKIRKKIPGVSITTDIIVGYPGETKSQFNNTKKLFGQAKFDMAYIAQYSPRYGTVAAKLDDNVSKEEKKIREKILTKILEKSAFANNKKYIGKTVRVLVEAIDKKGLLIGKTRTNKVVKIYVAYNSSTPYTLNLVGEFVNVKIIKVKNFGLEGEIIRNESNNRIIVIAGTTASGKTKLAVNFAYKFNGEIISADSRQVYKYMDVGSGKDLREYKLEFPISNNQFSNNFKITKKQKRRYINIPYHLISIVHPNTEFSLAKWRKKALKAIDDILERGKVPIVVGGTGLYLQALVQNYNLSKVGPDKKLREKLEKKTLKQLLDQLKSLDLEKYKILNNSEKNNKRHLIRYIEIAINKPDKAVKILKNKYNFLVMGLTYDKATLRDRIYKRLIERLEKEFMVEEVEELHRKHRVSWRRLEGFGLEYKFISFYLQKKISYEKMIKQITQASTQFAKRQITWLRRWEKQGQKIHWLVRRREQEELVKDFLKK